MTQQNAFSLAGPVARQLHRDLLAAVASLGPFREEVKKTSVHWVRGSAFAGVHPRKQHLLLTIKADKPVRHRRIIKSEQISKNRWHLDLKLSEPGEIDAELLGWLREAYDLCQ